MLRKEYKSVRFGIVNLIDHSESDPLQESIKYLTELRTEKKIICEDTGVNIIINCFRKDKCHIFLHKPDRCINDEALCYWLK